MRKDFLLLLLFLSASLFAQEFTIEESVALGIRNNKDLKNAASRLKYASAKVSETSSYLLPRLSLTASYTRLSDVPPFQVQVPFLPDPIRISDVILDQYNLRLTLQQPVFTGLKLSSIKSASEYNQTSMEYEYSREMNEAAFEVYKSFWNYYKAGNVLNLISHNLKQLEMHVSNTRNFLENGLVTANDLLKLEVQYSNTELMKTEAQNNLELARMQFNKSVGLDLSLPSVVKAEDELPAFTEMNNNQLISEAISNRSEIIALENKIYAAEKNISAESSGWLPSLYLTGNFYYSRPNQRIIPAQDKFNDTWDVGLVLSWDIWNWGQTSSKVEQAEQLRFQAENALFKMNEMIEMEVKSSYFAYKRSYEQIIISSKSLQQAKENLRITAEKYNQQLATVSDLIDAEVLVLQAETNLTASRADYNIARAQLEKSLGRKIY